ncbi:MAG TPA: PKD domain-containing protein [Candidatus Fraserbacteria bacterium]|nr:PKD domain-containing protein [Candidatus Fraserbacteria bacterium]
MKSYLKLLMLPLLLTLLAGCSNMPGWESATPPPDVPQVTVAISTRCPDCLQAQSGAKPLGTAPLAMTFQANVTLANPAQESVIVYNWDFGDGTQQEGFRLSHTFKQVGIYRVQVRIVTSSGAQAQDSLTVRVKPQPAPPAPEMQIDTVEGELCSFTRILPPQVRVGDQFIVELQVQAKKDVQVAVVEDKVWFSQFHVLDNPEAIWLQLKAGERKILKYRVKLLYQPSQTWMEGELSCNAGGLGNSEVLTLKSVVNVVQ